MSLLPKSKPGRSIRTTLLCWLLPFAAIFMGVAWVLHGVLLERMTRDFVKDRLYQEAAFIEQNLRATPAGDGNQIAFQHDSFNAASHHVYAVSLAGRELYSHPDWSAQLQPWLTQPEAGLQTLSTKLPGQSAPSYFLAYRATSSVEGQPLIIVVAEDYSVLKAGEQELHLWTALVAVALLLLLIGMIWLAVHLSLRPTTQLRHQLQQLRQGGRSRLDEAVPAEFQRLTQQLNQLLDTLDQRLERSRHTNANLSHSVKTPIAAITQMLSNTQQPIDDAMRTQITSKLAEINLQLDTSMRSAQAAGPQAGKNANPVVQARDMLWMLGRLYANKRFELDIQNRRTPALADRGTGSE